MELATLRNHMRKTAVERINIRLMPNNEAVLIIHYYLGQRPPDIMDWDNHRILRASLAHWFMVYGVPLTIDDEPMGTIQRYNEELLKGYFPSCKCHFHYRDATVHSRHARKTRAGTRRTSRL